MLRFILEDKEFPREIQKVISSAFLRTDAAFAEACSLDSALASGTTALAAVVMGRLVKFSSLYYHQPVPCFCENNYRYTAHLFHEYYPMFPIFSLLRNTNVLNSSMARFFSTVACGL